MGYKLSLRQFPASHAKTIAQPSHCCLLIEFLYVMSSYIVSSSKILKATEKLL